MQHLHLFRKIVLLALGLGLGLGLAGPVQARPSVTIGTVTWIGFAGFYVADALNLYDPYDVDVELVNFPDNTEMLTKFDQGKVDVCLVTYEKVIEETAKKNPIKVLLAVDYSNGGDMLVASQTITDISALKGKAVGLEFLSPGALLFDYALMQNKMQISDVQAQNMGPEEVNNAMEKDSIVAGVSYEPYVSMLLSGIGSQKFHVLYSSKDAPGLITDVMVARTGYIQEHAEALKAVMRGYRDALAYMQKEPDKTAKLLAPIIGSPLAEIKAQLEMVRIPGLQEMLDKNFTQAESIDSFYTSGKIIGTVLQKRGKIQETPDISQTFDATLLKAVLAE